jgi:hypothetical protein
MKIVNRLRASRTSICLLPCVSRGIHRHRHSQSKHPKSRCKPFFSESLAGLLHIARAMPTIGKNLCVKTGRGLATPPCFYQISFTAPTMVKREKIQNKIHIEGTSATAQSAATENVIMKRTKQTPRICLLPCVSRGIHRHRHTQYSHSKSRCKPLFSESLAWLLPYARHMPRPSILKIFSILAWLLPYARPMPRLVRVRICMNQ